MTRKYDLNDPTDLDIMRNDYNSISQDEWQEYIEFTRKSDFKHSFTFEERGCLIRMAKQAGSYRKPADKDIKWGLSIVEKVKINVIMPDCLIVTSEQKENQVLAG